MNSFGISVIVCCYNSASRLEETLKHIAAQQLSNEIEQEVILVDNNSTDNTQEIARKIWASLNIFIPFKIVIEKNAGLSFARSKGIQTAQYEILIFCDDDNWLDKNYLQNAFRVMNANDNIGILGGQSSAVFETNEPVWFPAFQQAYAVGKPLEKTGFANARNFIAGAAMITRKSVFDKLDEIKFSSRLTGRKGTKLSSGEDSELCLVLMMLGYDLYYDEDLHFRHYMSSARLSWKYCVKMIAHGQAIPQVYFYFYNYCFDSLKKNISPSFHKSYKIAIKRFARKVLGFFKPASSFFNTGKMVFFSSEGNKNEIKFKAELTKLFFLLFNKKKLQKDFYQIHTCVTGIIKSTNDSHAKNIGNSFLYNLK